MTYVMRGKEIERYYLKQGKSWCSHTMLKLILKRQRDRQRWQASLALLFFLYGIKQREEIEEA